MKFKDSIKFALSNLSTRGIRSWLTIIGVVIGVAAIVSIVSVGQGMQEIISTQLGALGGDQVYVIAGSAFENGIMPGAKKPGELTDIDLKNIKSVEGVIYAAPDAFGFVDISYMGETKRAYLLGTDENWIKVREKSFRIEDGRFLSKGDRNVVVLGNKIAKDTFNKDIYIGSQIKIENDTFRVIGILEEVGGLAGADEDKSIYMSLEDSKKYAKGFGVDDYYAIEVRVEPERAEEIAEKIKEKLMKTRHVTEETRDFSVYTPKMITQTAMGILNTINIFVYGIAAISLLVGAVGITNTMFTSVLERTRQIGILKALGLNKKGIMKLFLIESAFIGLIGGIIGLFIGFIISGTIGYILSIVLASSRFSGTIILIKPQLIIFSLLFSTILGIFSGIIPARQAANLEPVEALHYE